MKRVRASRKKQLAEAIAIGRSAIKDKRSRLPLEFRSAGRNAYPTILILEAAISKSPT
jgi:hypothetical protein